jgi:membrane protein DedA with SNARE-associated domain
MHFHVQNLAQYGYGGVFVILLVETIGIPFPAETTLTIAGFEWMRGTVSLVPLLLAATLGNVVGSTIGYGIGYFLGRPVIVRFGRYVGITSEKLEAADQKFARYRGTLTLFGKFIAGIRVLVPYLAGINRMPFAVFSVYNAVSALVWAGFFIIVGRYVEVAWSHYHKVIHQYLLTIIVVAIVVVGIVMVVKVRSRQRSKA